MHLLHEEGRTIRAHLQITTHSALHDDVDRISWRKASLHSTSLSHFKRKYDFKTFLKKVLNIKKVHDILNLVVKQMIF